MLVIMNPWYAITRAGISQTGSDEDTSVRKLVDN